METYFRPRRHLKPPRMSSQGDDVVDDGEDCSLIGGGQISNLRNTLRRGGNLVGRLLFISALVCLIRKGQLFKKVSFQLENCPNGGVCLFCGGHYFCLQIRISLLRLNPNFPLDHRTCDLDRSNEEEWHHSCWCAS